MQEETFGPILPIVTYKNVDEAIQLINGKDKPLVVYYFGSANLSKIRDETSSGAFIVNEYAL